MTAPDLAKLADHRLSRNRAALVGVAIGIVAGFINMELDLPELRWPYSWTLPAWLIAGIATVILLHEGIHGLAAVVLGHRPVFGIKFPFVYTTFRHKLPRNALIVIALAPLFVLDAVGFAFYLYGVQPFFSILCIEINTIGAIGDCWIVWKLLGHDRSVFVQDTMTGIEVWGRAA